MQIDKKTHNIDKINYHTDESIKTQIVIGFSLRKNDYHIRRLKHKDFGKTKKWNTYTINRDGLIYQHYPDKYYSDFIGNKVGDKKSISIVLENMSCLFKTPNNEYVNWLNETCELGSIIEKRWLGYNFWEKLNDKQIQSLVLLCDKLCMKYDIPKKCIEFQSYHKDIIKYNGIIFRSNYINDSSDINPTFDIERFNGLLNNTIV